MTQQKNNIYTFDLIDERDIHAYIDGQLDEARLKKVEAYLQKHPDIAAEVEDYVRYNRMLGMMAQDITEETVPPRLMQILQKPVRPEIAPMAKIAAVAMLCLLSASAGWIGAQRGAGETIHATQAPMPQIVAEAPAAPPELADHTPIIEPAVVSGYGNNARMLSHPQEPGLNNTPAINNNVTSGDVYIPPALPHPVEINAGGYDDISSH